MMTLFLTLLVCISGFAQTEKRIYTSSEKAAIEKARIQADSALSAKAKADAKALKELRKRIEAQEDSLSYATAVNSLEHLDFVLEADKLIFKYGEIAYVSSITNFISVRDDKAVVQVAPFNGGGPNGVGGITLNGMASNIKMSTDKKGTIYYSFNVQGAGISAVINLTIPKGVNSVNAVINPNFSSNRITLSGKIVPAAESKVFKGTSIF